MKFKKTVGIHEKCLICSSEKLISLKNYQKAFLKKCKKCGFIFSGEIPTNDDLIEHYKGYGRNDYLSPITIKRYNELLDLFEKYRITNNLIDVGCGIGYFAEEAKKRGWNVYGTEYTMEAINICKKKGIIMNEGILNPINYNFKFDITSFEVVEHINNPKEEINNYNQILRKGGLFCTTQISIH